MLECAAAREYLATELGKDLRNEVRLSLVFFGVIDSPEDQTVVNAVT